MSDLTSRVADGADIELKLRGLERLRLAGILDEGRFQTMRAALLAAAPAAPAAAVAPARAAPPPLVPAAPPAVTRPPAAPTAPPPLAPAAPPAVTHAPAAPAAPPPPPPWGVAPPSAPWWPPLPPAAAPPRTARGRTILVGLASVLGVALVAGAGGLVLARHASSSATTGTAAADQARQAAIDDALAHPGDANGGTSPLGGLGLGPAPGVAPTPPASPVVPSATPPDVILAADSLPRGSDLGAAWGPEYGYHAGPAASLSPGCTPSSVTSTEAAYAQSTFDYGLKADGTTGGYLQVQAIALTSTAAAAPALAAVSSPQFTACKGAEIRSAFAADHPALTQTGATTVTTTGEVLAGIRVTHLRIVIPVTSQGKPSTEVADVYYAVVGRVRVTGRFTSCPCTEIPAADRTAAMTVILQDASAVRP